MAETYLTQRQICERLHLSARSLERMRTDGTGPAFVRATPGNKRGRILYRETDVEAWLATRRRTSTSDSGPRAKRTGGRYAQA